MRLRLRHGRRRFDPALLTAGGVRAVGAAAAVGLAAALLAAAPASSQVAAAVSVTSDYRYRGVAISAARPAASLDLAYDAQGGAYAAGSLIAGDAPDAGPRLLGVLADIGYARRAGGLTLDAGISHASFFRYGYGVQSSETTEAYAGLIRGPLRAYLYYAPHYFAPGLKTLYLSLDGSVRPARRLRLFGHLGVLDAVGAPSGVDWPRRYDARAGAAVQFRGFEVQLAWTTRSGGATGPPGESPRRNAVVLGASRFF